MSCVQNYVSSQVDANVYPLLRWHSVNARALPPGTPACTVGGVRCLRVLPSGRREPPRDAVLYLHGNAMTLRSLYQTNLLQRVANSTNSVVYAPEYVGYEPEANVMPRASGDRLDRLQVKRVRLVLSHLPQSSVVVMGRSLGAAIAVAAMSDTKGHDDRVQGLILISPFYSLRNMVPSMWFGADRVVRYYVQDRLDNAKGMCKISAHVPVQIVAGVDDELVLPQQSQRLFRERERHVKRCKSGAMPQLSLIPGMTHCNMLSVTNFDEILGRVHKKCTAGAVPPQEAYAIIGTDSE